MGCSTVLWSRLCKFCVGNCFYISASWKQSSALRDRVITGVLQIIGLCFANHQFFAPYKASEQFFSLRHHVTMWVLQIIRLSQISMLVTIGRGSLDKLRLELNVGTSSSKLNTKSHIV